MFDCTGLISKACAAIFLSRNHFGRCSARRQAGGGDQGEGQFAHVFLLCVLVELALSLHPLPHFIAGAAVVDDVVNIGSHLTQRSDGLAFAVSGSHGFIDGRV
jgi:hypothetical protein